MSVDTSRNQQNLSIKMTAFGALIVLLISLAWKLYPHTNDARVGESQPPITTSNVTVVTSTSSPLEQLTSTATTSLGPQIMNQILVSYETLKQSGQFSSTTASIMGDQISASTPSHAQYTPITRADIRTSPDTSKKAMLAYRAQLQKALKPLLANSQSEIGLFSQYESTENTAYLTELSAESQNYILAASNTKVVVAPQDAQDIHIGIINAMNEFSATLDTMTQEANDPIGSAAALKMFSQAHSDMVTSFGALATYINTKQ